MGPGLAGTGIQVVGVLPRSPAMPRLTITRMSMPTTYSDPLLFRRVRSCTILTKALVTLLLKRTAPLVIGAGSVHRLGKVAPCCPVVSRRLQTTRPNADARYAPPARSCSGVTMVDAALFGEADHLRCWRSHEPVAFRNIDADHLDRRWSRIWRTRSSKRGRCDGGTDPWTRPRIRPGSRKPRCTAYRATGRLGDRPSVRSPLRSERATPSPRTMPKQHRYRETRPSRGPILTVVRPTVTPRTAPFGHFSACE
ncbi:hypothetical protein ABIA39_009020 [Nocardia sp. GAS34]